MTRPALATGAAAALALLVMWMIPPTTPQAVAPGTWRDAVRAVRPHTDDGETFAAAAAPAPALPVAAQPALETYSYPPQVVAAVAAEPSRYRAAPTVRQTRRTDDGGDVQEAVPQASDDRASDAMRYRSGYAWAADRDVQDARECWRWRGDPSEDGCLDYLRDQDDREERSSRAEW